MENYEKIKEKLRADEYVKNGGKHSSTREKVFVPRESVITELRKIPDIDIIYRTFLVALFMLYVRFVVDEYINHETVTFGTKYIMLGFNNFKVITFLWFFMFSLTLLVFPIFQLWSVGVKKLIAQKFILRIWNFCWLLSTFLYVAIMIYVPLQLGAFTHAMVCNLIVLFEQVRFFMKFHAFLRHNCAIILKYKPHSEKEEIGPKFSSYLYYLFAPTFIYKEEYPRTPKTNWSHVFTLTLEFFGCMFWASFLLHSAVERFKNFGLVKETYGTLFLSILDAVLVGPFFWLTGFYILLHVWLNIWSELLRFADRRFYADWWNCQDFSTYYRNWNLVVHGYLHEYIYKDIVSISKNKTLATFTTFLVSIIVHEYILGFFLGFFFPMLGIHFAMSAVLLKLKGLKVFNYFFLTSVAIGTAIEMSTYCMEYFARQNCPIEDESYWRYIEIRSLTCNGLNL